MCEIRRARIGVIGAGGIANGVHLPSLHELDEVQITAICDLRLEKAKAAAERFGDPCTRVYWNMYEMLEQEPLDGVLVLVEPDRLDVYKRQSPHWSPASGRGCPCPRAAGSRA